MERPPSILPVLERFSPGCSPPPRASKRGPLRAGVLIGVHVLILLHIAHWKITGRTLSPLEPSEAGETLTLGYVNAGFILLSISILATLIFGRFFCGWACHVVALQDLCAWLLGKMGIRPRPLRSRLLVFVPFLAAALMFVVPSLLRLMEGAGMPALSAHLMTDDLWARFPGPAMATLTLAVDGFLVVYLLGAKGFCTYGCPYGALFSVADRIAPVRVRVNDDCEGCGHCTATCTSNVRVHEEVARFGMVVDPGCMRCLDCVSVCPKNALALGAGPLPIGKRAKRQYDLSWPEEILAALVFIGGLYAFRGLYDSVPFLLAIGLSVLASVAALSTWRLLRNPGMRLQHHTLRSEGRYTTAGWSALAIMPLFLGFTLHSGFIQSQVRQGDRLISLADSEVRGSAAWVRRIEDSLVYLERAARWGLAPSSELHNKIGQLWFNAQDLERAEHHLRRSAELDQDQLAARVRLADLLRVQGKNDAALALLRAVLDRDPDNEAARARLQFSDR